MRDTRIITSLARRAYRRPATADELGRLLAFYRSGREQGSFERGIESALRGMLANPKFLVRRAESAPATAGARGRTISISASRLSFFLWSSIPDDELIDLAVARRLSRPAVLEQQVRRMLADSRAESLVTNFAAQWLQLRNLRSAAPDKNLFPDFDDNLRQAFQRETELFVASIIQGDRPRARPAERRLHIPQRTAGAALRHPRRQGQPLPPRVARRRPERHGLLGQGSILLLTSHADRTAPVVRGKWVLENLLGVPPPPPAANVPPLTERGRRR